MLCLRQDYKIGTFTRSAGRPAIFLIFLQAQSMKNDKLLGYFLITCGLIALAFLLYSLSHLKELNISIYHPRVLVELILFLCFVAIGLYLILR